MNLKQKEMLQQISDSIITMNDVIGSNPIDPVMPIYNYHSLSFIPLH